jgi:(p)ppGpp synthase/HD superfamily hydrolase
MENARVQLAREVAELAHKGQVDKLGKNYIDHPFRVHRNLLTNPEFQALDRQAQEDCEVAALLHDVIEDSGDNGSQRFEKEDLIALGFTQRSIELVELLTRVDGVDKDVYYQAINENMLARLVKWADIADNLNKYRTQDLEPEIFDRLAARYEHALAMIPLAPAGLAWMENAKELPLATQPLGAVADRQWEEANG